MASFDVNATTSFHDIGLFVTRNSDVNQTQKQGQSDSGEEHRFETGFGYDYENRARRDMTLYRNDHFDQPPHAQLTPTPQTLRQLPVVPHRGRGEARVVAQVMFRNDPTTERREISEEEYPRLAPRQLDRRDRYGVVVRDGNFISQPYAFPGRVSNSISDDGWATSTSISPSVSNLTRFTSGDSGDPEEVWMRTQRRAPVVKVPVDDIPTVIESRPCELNRSWIQPTAAELKKRVLKMTYPDMLEEMPTAGSPNDSVSSCDLALKDRLPGKVFLLNDNEIVDLATEQPEKLNLARIFAEKKVQEAATIRADLDTVSIGPTAAALMTKYLSKETETSNNDHALGPVVRYSMASTSTDPLSRVQMSLPDQYNYSQEKNECIQKYISAAVKKVTDKRVLAAAKNSNFALSIGSGGSSSIYWLDRDDDASILMNTINDKEEVERRYGKYPGLVQVVPLTENDKRLWFEQNGNMLSKNACRVVFASAQDAQRMLLAEKTPVLAQVFPKCLLAAPIASTSAEPGCGGSLTRESEVTTEMHMELRWYTSPSKKCGVLVLNDPTQVFQAEQALCDHGIPVGYNEHRTTVGNKQLDLKFGFHTKDPEAYDDRCLFAKVTKILSANGITFSKVYLHRSVPQSVKTEKIRLTNLIHQRLVRACINAGLWRGDQPTERTHWEKLYQNAHELPWKVDVITKEEVQHQGRATVKFLDYDMGERVFTYLRDLSPDPDVFSLYRYDSLGVRFESKYRQKVPIPVAVRIACDVSINDFDHSLRANATSEVWARLIEPPTASDMIAVEGYPLQYVSNTVTHLLSLFDGVIIDCSNMEQNGRLLYGYGADWVATVRAQLAPRIIIISDVILERIRLIGDGPVVDEARRLLRLFVEQRDRFGVHTSVVIRAPRYLDIMREVLDYIKIPHLRTVIGGGQMQVNRKTHEVLLKGSVDQAEALHNYLDELDAELTAACRVAPSRPVCPVCLSPVLTFSYCLDACGHYYCMPCLAAQVHNGIRTRELPLKCLVDDCNQPMAIDDIQKLLFGDYAMHQLPLWFFSDRLNLFMRSSLDSLLAASVGQMQACASPDCFGIFLSDDVDPSTSSISCSTCNRQKCSRCMYEPHPGIDCDAYEKIRQDADASLSAYRNSNTKDTLHYCPRRGCKAAIERTAGCNHMQCSFCKTHFCWLCGKEAESQSEIYKHMSESSCGTGGGWRIENGMILEAPPDEPDMDGFPDDFMMDAAADLDAQLAMAVQLNEQRLVQAARENFDGAVVDVPPGFEFGEW